jgi:hypothetical protein
MRVPKTIWNEPQNIVSDCRYFRALANTAIWRVYDKVFKSTPELTKSGVAEGIPAVDDEGHIATDYECHQILHPAGHWAGILNYAHQFISATELQYMKNLN